MRRIAALARVLTGLFVTYCIAVAPAGATDFCVAPAAGCDGGQKPTLQVALDAALGAIGPDTVRLPAGTVNGPGSYTTVNPDNTVSVIGAGREATVVTSTTSTPGDHSLDLRNSSTLSDLTLRQATPAVPNQAQLSLSGTAERVSISAPEGTGYSSISGTARNISVTGPSGLHISGTLEDSQITGGHLYTGTGDTFIRRVRSVGPSPVGGQNRNLHISSSLFVLTAPTGPVAGFEISPVVDSQATFVLSNVTLVGAAGAGCVGAELSANNVYPPPDDDSLLNATIANTVVRGCGTTLHLDSGGPNGTANALILHSDIDLSPAAVTQTGPGTITAGPGELNLNVDPLFLGLPGLEQELRFNSPAVDRGLKSLVSSNESGTDLNGNPRVVDGNGDGVATRDIGAFEYQRRAPAVSASASAPTAEIGQAVTFTGSATEADPGESVAVLAWRFDDGGVATGSDAPHAFGTPGAHTATLTATDSAGVAGTATATVTVLAAPTVTSLSLSPATFRAAARGASTAAKRRRPPVGTAIKLGLSRPAAVTLRVQRRANGRRSGKRCVAPSSRNRRAKACTRTVAVRGSITRRSGAPGKFRFTGRLSGRKLAAGRYFLVAQAGKTPAKTAAFRIVR